MKQETIKEIMTIYDKLTEDEKRLFYQFLKNIVNKRKKKEAAQ